MAAIARHSRRGRPGVPALRAALAEWVLDGKPVDSILEPAMRRLLADHGLPPAEFHPVIAGYEVDFRIIDSPIVLECDGWSTHGLDKVQFERDRTRDAELGRARLRRAAVHLPRHRDAPGQGGRTHPPQRRSGGRHTCSHRIGTCSGWCADGLTSSGPCGGGSSKGSTRW